MRLVVLCRLVFLLPSWVPLPSPPPLGVPLKKTVYFVRPRYPRAPVSLLTCGVRCFPFFFFPYFPSFLLSFCGPLSVRPVRLLLPFSFPSVAPSLWEAGLSRGPGTTVEGQIFASKSRTIHSSVPRTHAAPPRPPISMLVRERAAWGLSSRTK